MSGMEKNEEFVDILEAIVPEDNSNGSSKTSMYLQEALTSRIFVICVVFLCIQMILSSAKLSFKAVRMMRKKRRSPVSPGATRKGLAVAFS
eukprot:1316929-Amorphochlora_amoeboformis.AAC.1